MELHVLLRDTALPTRDQWQEAITQAGFKLILDSTLDVRKSKGFRPCIYGGVKTGFEFDLFPAASVTSRYSEVAERIDARDVSANFRWGGEMRERVAVYVASAVLTKLGDGILYDPQEGSFFSGDEALATTRQLIAEETDLD